MGKLKVKSMVICNKGNVRETNQDNFLLNGKYNDIEKSKDCVNVIQSKDDIQLYGVFDGMGGMQDGEEAALISVKFADAYRKKLMLNPKMDMKNIMEEYFYNTNKGVCEMLKQEGGTTAAMIWLNQDVLYGANIGDSRIYLFRDNTLRQLSCDHTEAALLKRLNTEYNGKSQSGLTQYLGVDSYEMIIEPFYFTLVPKNDDMVLICTDGLTSYVSNEDIKTTLMSESDIEVAGQELLRRVKLANGRDNTTIMLLSFKKRWSIY